MQKNNLMKLRKTVAIMATAAMTMTMPVTALAAPATYKQSSDVSNVQKANLMSVDLHPIFDATVYAAKNSDVVAQVGNDPEALYQHFITTGINQNREFNSTYSMSDIKKLLKGYASQFGGNNRLYLAMFLQKMAQSYNQDNAGASVTTSTITAEQIASQNKVVREALRDIIDDINTSITQSTDDKNNNQDNNNDDEKKDNFRFRVAIPDLNRNNGNRFPHPQPNPQPNPEVDELEGLRTALENFWDAYDKVVTLEDQLIELSMDAFALEEALEAGNLTLDEAKEKLADAMEAQVEATRAYDEANENLREAMTAQAEAVRAYNEANGNLREARAEVTRLEGLIEEFDGYTATLAGLNIDHQNVSDRIDELSATLGSANDQASTAEDATLIAKLKAADDAFNTAYAQQILNAEAATAEATGAYERVYNFINGKGTQLENGQFVATDLNDADQNLYNSYVLMRDYVSKFQVLRAENEIMAAAEEYSQMDPSTRTKDQQFIMDVAESLSDGSMSYTVLTTYTARDTKDWYERVQEVMAANGVSNEDVASITQQLTINGISGAYNVADSENLGAFVTETAANEKAFDGATALLATVVTDYMAPVGDFSLNEMFAQGMTDLHSIITDLENQLIIANTNDGQLDAEIASKLGALTSARTTYSNAVKGYQDVMATTVADYDDQQAYENAIDNAINNMVSARIALDKAAVAVETTMNNGETTDGSVSIYDGDSLRGIPYSQLCDLEAWTLANSIDVENWGGYIVNQLGIAVTSNNGVATGTILPSFAEGIDPDAVDTLSSVLLPYIIKDDNNNITGIEWHEAYFYAPNATDEILPSDSLNTVQDWDNVDIDNDYTDAQGSNIITGTFDRNTMTLNGGIFAENVIDNTDRKDIHMDVIDAAIDGVVDDLQDNMEDAELAESTLKTNAENSQLGQDRTAAGEAVNQAVSDLADLNMQLDDIEDDIDEVQNNMIDWVAENGTYDEVQDDLDDAKDAVDDARDEVIEAQADVINAMNDVAEAKDEVNEAQAVVDDVTADVAEANDEVNEAQAVVDDIQEELDEVNEQIDEIVPEYTEAVNDLYDAADKVEEEEDKVTEEQIAEDPDVEESLEEFHEVMGDNEAGDEGAVAGDEGGIDDEIGEAGNPIADMGEQYAVDPV